MYLFTINIHMRFLVYQISSYTYIYFIKLRGKLYEHIKKKHPRLNVFAVIEFILYCMRIIHYK